MLGVQKKEYFAVRIKVTKRGNKQLILPDEQKERSTNIDNAKNVHHPDPHPKRE